MSTLAKRSTVMSEGASAADPARALGLSLQAPLDELLAVAGLLQRQALSADGRAQCEALQAAARTLKATLDAACLPADSSPPRESTSLQGLVDAVDAGWQARAVSGGPRLVLSRRFESDARVRIDAEGFRRTLDGLIGEALEVAESGVVEATLRANPVEERVRVTAVLACPTSPVASGESPALRACRRWAAAVGGEVQVGATAGGGRQVELCFSVDCAAAEVEPPPTPAEDLVAVEPRVLIVDDNATNRTVAEALCGLFGFVCEAACDGQEALEAAGARDFDLILMDIRMPRLDGVEATRAIRALPGAAGRTPIVALTANADPADVALYLAAGMCAVVEKPIKPDRLLQAIGEALDGPTDPVDADLTRTAA